MFKRIVIETSTGTAVYEGDRAQALAAWINGALEIAQIRGMLCDKPAPTRMVSGAEDAFIVLDDMMQYYVEQRDRANLTPSERMRALLFLECMYEIKSRLAASDLN